MGGIADEDVEWAIVDRFKQMLEHPPRTKFNVTQAFAHFVAILMWTKNRAWAADHAAADARDRLRSAKITEDPWRLPLMTPMPPRPVDDDGQAPGAEAINQDFLGMDVETFTRWLRNAIAHGDGRNIKPLHKPNRNRTRTLLAGFKISGELQRGSGVDLTLDLYLNDMIRVGRCLANLFCSNMSGELHYREIDQATAVREGAA